MLLLDLLAVFLHPQEASAIFRRKQIYEALHPETKAGVAGASARWNGKDANENSAFALATSDAIGKSRRSVEISAARGEALGEDIEAVAGTSLDKGVELDALAKLPEEERYFDPCMGALHGSWQSMHVHVTSRML